MIKTQDKAGTTKVRDPGERFLFDQNNFDDDFEEEIIEEEPPPPTYSEEELAAARDAAYREGKKDGLAEAAASREKQIAELIAKITDHFKTLFAAEQLREQQYESEAVLLAQTIFQRLFPALNEREGLAEVQAVIASVLDTQKDAGKLVIEVHPEDTQPIEERLQGLVTALAAAGDITVQGNETLQSGDCTIRWDDGGAQRRIHDLAEEIHRQLEHMLADRPTLQDNREDQAVDADDDTINGDTE